MDLLNKIVNQLSNSLKTMTPGARITAGSLLVVIVISVAYMAKLARTDQATFLMGGTSFATSQLTNMEVAFAQVGLNDYTIEGNRIRVPHGKQSAYMRALAEKNALPPTFGKHLEEASKANSLLMDKTQRQTAAKLAKQKELQLLINDVEGVESAVVIYDNKEPQGFNREEFHTASIGIKLQGGNPLDPQRAQAIRKMAASSIAGLKAENITITDLANFDGRSKKYREKEWTETITHALAGIPGVVVTPRVELDADSTPASTSERVSVAVSIPSDYYSQVWLERNRLAHGRATKPNPKDLAEIETKVKQDVHATVVALLPPVSSSTDPSSRVTVTNLANLSHANGSMFDMRDQALAWLKQYWRIAGMVGLVVVSLVLLRSTVRTTPQTKTLPSATFPEELAELASPHIDLQPEHAPTVRPSAANPSLRSELSDLVKDHPDAAVSVLRAWIGNVN